MGLGRTQSATWTLAVWAGLAWAAGTARAQAISDAPLPHVVLPAPTAPSATPSPAPPSAPLAPQASRGQTAPLKLVSREQFCGRLQQMFADYGNANGYDQMQTALLAINATGALVSDFRAGRAADFVNTAALATLANAPARADGGYLPISGFLGQAMGVGQNVALALSAGELRFLPYAQRGVDLLLIAQNAAALTPDRARKVADMAAGLGIHINVVWVGGEAEASAVQEAGALAWLAAVTGGAFANLAGTGDPCARRL